MRVSRPIVAVVLVTPLLLIAAYVVLSNTGPSGTANYHPSRFEIDSKSFTLTYLATNETAREKGLMDTKVTNGTTMLFVFPKSDFYSFWMYHVNSSLDIIWINATAGVGRVVYLVENVPGCSVSILCSNYQPTAKADLVLEAKGGFARANGVAVGTVITFH